MNPHSLRVGLLVAAVLSTNSVHATVLENTRDALAGPANVRLGGNTGSASSVIAIDAPPARGRFQPSMAVVYSSDAGMGTAGWGWSVPLSYAELSERATPDPITGGDRSQLWLTMAGARMLMVEITRDSYGPVPSSYFVPESSSGFLRAKVEPEASWRDQGIDHVDAWDAAGTRYVFSTNLVGARRWYLASATDANGNMTTFTYEMAAGRTPHLMRVDYNVVNFQGAARAANSIVFEYNEPETSAVVADAALVLRQGPLLSSVKVQRLDASAPTGAPFQLGSYYFSYTSTGADRKQVSMVSRLGAYQTIPDWRTTQFTYAAPVPPQLQPAITVPLNDPNGLVTPSAADCTGWGGPWPEPPLGVDSSVVDQCAGTAGAVLVDLDADHRPDLVWSVGGKLWWSRNQTENTTETSGAILAFTNVVELPGSTGWPGILSPRNPSGAVGDGTTSTGITPERTTARMQDINGDGRPDLVSIDATLCPADGHLAVRFASAYVGFFDAPVCMDTSAVTPAWTGVAGATKPFALSFVKFGDTVIDLLDLTGDGIADFVFVSSTGVWSVYPGYQRSDGTWAFSSAFRTPSTALSRTAIRSVDVQGVTNSDLVDLNGDGLPDRVSFESSAWRVEYNSGRNFAAVSPGAGTSFALVPSGESFGQDLTREGRPSYDVTPAGAGNQWVIRPPLLSGAPGEATLTISGFPCSLAACPDGSGYKMRSAMTLEQVNPPSTSYAFAGYSGQWIDMNGDGILDYVVAEASGNWVWYRGTTGSTSAAPPGALVQTTQPSGLVESLDWVPSSRFDNTPLGLFKYVVGSRRLVERKYGQDDNILSTIAYGYGGQNVPRALDEPSRIEQLGFQDTYTVDSQTGATEHIRWSGQPTFAGHADLMELSFTANLPWLPWQTLSNGQTVGTMGTVVKSVARTAQALALGSSWSSEAGPNTTCTGVPQAGDFPVVVFDTLTQETTTEMAAAGPVSLSSSRTVDCADVDVAGNLKSVTVVPDTQAPQARNYVERANYPSIALPWDDTKGCKNCPTESGATTVNGSATLRWRRYHYDAPLGQFDGDTFGTISRGNLNGAEDLVSGERTDGAYEPSAKVSYLDDGRPFQTLQLLPGQCDRVILKTFEYDVFGLGVTKETTAGERVVMVVDTTLDPITGRAIARSRPHRPGEQSVLEVAMAYDGWGRLRATGRLMSPVASDGSYTVSDLTSAVEYQWASVYTPGVTIARRFGSQLAGVSTDRWGNMAVASFNRLDVLEARSYVDYLGRPLYSALRLGSAGGTSDPAANIGEGLTGWLISGYTDYDATLRPFRTLEPFYASGPEASDLGAVVYSPRAMLIVRDAQGRTVCIQTRPYGKAAELDGDAVACVSNDMPGPGYRTATRTQYGASTDASGRNYITVDQWPTWKAPITPARTYLDASGQAVFSTDAEGITRRESMVDLVEGSVAQVTTAGGQTLRVKTFMDKRGRVIKQIDDAAVGPGVGGDARVRVQSYFASGALAWAGMSPGATSDPQGTVGVQYVYGSLGRLVSQLDRDKTSGTWVTKGRTNQYFDTPMGGDSSAYANTYGRLSRATTCTQTGSACELQTTVAFGYDPQGRVLRRDQWFKDLGSAAPDPSSRHSLQQSYSWDGRVLGTTMQSASLPGGAASWSYVYDSALRLKRIATANSTMWEAQTAVTTGAYDALGRLPVAMLDDGHLQEMHAYDTMSGLEYYYSHLRRTNLVTSWTDATKILEASGMTYEGPRLTSMTELVSGTTTTSNYDTAGRLTQVTAAAASDLSKMNPLLAQRFTETYSSALDGSTNSTAQSLWNLSLVTRTDPTLTSQQMDQYAYNPAKPDELTALAHPAPDVRTASSLTTDASRGFITQAPSDTAGTMVTLGYDTQNRLATIGTAAGAEETLSYGPFGELCKRVIGTTAVRYLVGESLSIEVKDGVTTAWAHVSIGGRRIASVWGSGGSSGVAYYQHDRLGSVIATSSEGGGAGIERRYDPYGAVTQSGTADLGTASERGYTGGVELSHGLLHLRARVYSVVLRRFLQADNVDSRRYSYVGGDPVNFTDPSGHRGVLDDSVRRYTNGTLNYTYNWGGAYTGSYHMGFDGHGGGWTTARIGAVGMGSVDVPSWWSAGAMQAGASGRVVEASRNNLKPFLNQQCRGCRVEQNELGIVTIFIPRSNWDQDTGRAADDALSSRIDNQLQGLQGTYEGTVVGVVLEWGLDVQINVSDGGPVSYNGEALAGHGSDPAFSGSVEGTIWVTRDATYGQTVAHEMLHDLGLAHGNVTYGGDPIVVYNNYLYHGVPDVMVVYSGPRSVSVYTIDRLITRWGY